MHVFEKGTAGQRQRALATLHPFYSCNRLHTKAAKIPACGKFSAADKNIPGTNRFRG
jgi:hypothetical protein